MLSTLLWHILKAEIADLHIQRRFLKAPLTASAHCAELVIPQQKREACCFVLKYAVVGAP